jgi:hypothetical protein
MPADILIVPNRGSSTLNPNIQFSGSAANTIRLEALQSGSVAFLGNSGSLFSIVDSMSGSLMAVSDISGLPILEVFSDDRVVMGKYNANALVVTGSRVGIGKVPSNATFDMTGSAIISGSLVVSGPSNMLDLISTETAAVRINGGPAGGSTAYESHIEFYQGWYGKWGLGVEATTSNFFIKSNTIFPSIGYAIYIDRNNLYVGINKTTTPNSQLDVNGDTIITGSLTVTGNINGNIASQLHPFLFLSF